jgi:hypothetical protein
MSTLRGQFIQCFLTDAIPLQVPFDTIKTLPMDEWSDISWFDAMNPRAIIPLSQALSLASLMNCKYVNTIFRKKVAYLNNADTQLTEEDVDRESCAMMDRFMRSGLLWLSALARLLEDMPHRELLELAVETFGGCIKPDPPEGPVAEKYRLVEMAIVRENLMRCLSKLDQMLVAIIEPSQCEQYDIDLEQKRIEALVVRIASRVFGDGMAVDVDRVIRQGFLAHMIPPFLRPNHQHTKQLQSILRTHLLPTTPGWLRCFIKS